MAGVLAIGVGSIGTLGKLFYEIIEGIHKGPLEAADAVGASPLQRLRWGVLPQVTPEITSFLLYRFEVNIRASAVLGLVGAGGIGSDLAEALKFKDFGTAGLGLIIVVLGTICVDTVSGAVRRRIVSGKKAMLDVEHEALLNEGPHGGSDAWPTSQPLPEFILGVDLDGVGGRPYVCASARSWPSCAAWSQRRCRSSGRGISPSGASSPTSTRTTTALR